MSHNDRLKHISAVCDNLHLPERGPPSPKHVQLFSYVGTIAHQGVLADLLAQQDVLSILAKQAKDTHQVELWVQFDFLRLIKVEKCIFISTVISVGWVFWPVKLSPR